MKSATHTFDNTFPITSGWRRYQHLLPICFVMVVAIVVRLPNLTESVWYDELWSTSLKVGTLRAVGYYTLYDIHPPLYLFLMYFWVNIFGDSELAIRIPPLLFGLGSIVLTYLLTARLRDGQTALLTSVLLALSPVHIWYSQEARQYAAVLFLLLGATYLFYRLRHTQSSKRTLILYGLAATAAVFTHYYAAIFLICFTFLAFRERPAIRWSVVILNGSILSILALFGFLKILVGGLSTSRGYLRTFQLVDLWQLFFNWYLFGNSLLNVPNTFDLQFIQRQPFDLLVLGLVVFLFLRGCKRLVASTTSGRGTQQSDVLLYLVAIPMFLLCLSLLGFKNFYVERSALAALPFFLIILATGALSFTSKPLALVSATFLILLSTLSLHSHYERSTQWTVYKPNPDWRSMSNYFDKQLSSTNEKILVFAQTPATELCYYNPQFREFSGQEPQQPDPLSVRNDKDRKMSRVKAFVQKYLPSSLWQKPSLDPSTVRAEIVELSTDQDVHSVVASRGTNTFYFILNEYWIGNARLWLSRISEDSRLRLLSEARFKGLVIYQYQLSEEAARKDGAN